MIAPDVNVLIYAHRKEASEHAAYAQWLVDTATGNEPFGLSELVCSAFVRIVTHAKVFNPPTSLSMACAFIERLRARPNCVLLRPGPKHWAIFVEMCERSAAQGKLVADAYHAALAIEHGCEWITTDSDFSRFAKLRWRHPLQRR